jgi:ABC-type sugar transport system substrate-binding protein
MSTEVDVLNILTDQEYLGYTTAVLCRRGARRGREGRHDCGSGRQPGEPDRQRGFERGIEEYGLEVVATGNHGWDPTLSQQVMAEILNSGVEFDGVLVSQCAENALAAFDAAGVDYPAFIGFGDTGAYMQKMLEINSDEIVTHYMVLSNPPGVGATGLNFALNLIAGKTLKDGVYAEARKIRIRSGFLPRFATPMRIRISMWISPTAMSPAIPSPSGSRLTKLRSSILIKYCPTAEQTAK